MAEKQTDLARRELQRGLAPREPLFDPFRTMDRLAEEMDRVFGDVFGRNWLSPRVGQNALRSAWRGDVDMWTPDVEVFHRNNELIVRADLPGLAKDDVKVDINDDRITISGERKKQHEEEKEGVYRSERLYGAFRREIPLPEGAMTDQAKAQFKDGVLEVTMPAPPEQVRRGRRLEIADQSAARK